MAETQICDGCKKPFQDGELTCFGFSSGEPIGAYHHLMERYCFGDMPVDCATNEVFRRGKGMAFGERGVHYQGNFYSLSHINEISETTEIGVDMNEAHTANVLKGDLSALLTRKPMECRRIEHSVQH